jgi:hypothetical protein
MTKLFVPACLIVTLSIFAPIAASPSKDDNSLSSAVDQFNKKAQRNATGRAQPPLTDAEVIAAIRAWTPLTDDEVIAAIRVLTRKTTGVTDEVYQAFQKIAETQQLPKGAELSYTTGWTGYRDYHFHVWWINLSIPTGENPGFSFRIRDRKLSSRKLTADEQRRIKPRVRGRDTNP